MKVLTSICLTIAFACAAMAQEAAGKIFEAIRNNDLSTVKALIGNGPAVNASAVNATDKRGTTPLMYAAAFGSAGSVKILLDAGADTNARSAFDVTALMWAVNDLEKVRLLIDKGARM